jgi:transposase
MSWRPEKLTRVQMAERRQAGVVMLQSGQSTQAAIARELDVSEAAVSQWKTKLATQGQRALAAQPATGRPAKLTHKQQRQLLRILKRGAVKAGFETDRWTQQRIQQVIAREFDVHYHQNYISRLMQKLGWSVQKPETRAMERDEDLIRAWLSRDWRRIKKSATARRRDRL